MRQWRIVVAVVFACGIFVGGLFFALISTQQPDYGAKAGAPPPTASGTIQAFMKIDGIPGESLDPNHKDMIQLEAYNWSEVFILGNPGSPGSAPNTVAGTVSATNFLFVAEYSKASPRIVSYCTSGRSIPRATVYVQRTDDQGRRVDFLNWTLNSVIITSYKTGFNILGDSRVHDEFSMNATSSIEVKYSQMNPDGTYLPPIATLWDIAKNRVTG